MMVAVRNLRIKYGHWAVKQTRGRVLNKVGMLTNGFWASLSIPYIVNKIMGDTSSCVGSNSNSYLWL
jgi:hypothetical protein